MDPSNRIKPLGILASFIYWLIPAVVLYTAHYLLVPVFVERTAQPYLVGYLIAWGLSMLFFFVAALAAFRLEGNPLTWKAFADRYRLKKMSGRDWLWTLAVLGLIITSYFGLGFTASWLARWPLFSPHPVFPAEFGPGGTGAHIPGAFMGMSITGVGWVAVVYLLGWFFNIAGEELWFRGYILPRQEKAFGKHAWIANGLMFTFNHIWQPWNLIVLLPGALASVWIVQRRKNTWIMIIVHGLLNASVLVMILLNALGFVV